MQDQDVNPYAPPKSTLKAEGLDSSKPLFFATSRSKLIVMSVCTFGLYEMYWVYKNFVLIKMRTESEIWPFWRAFFTPFWVYSCFKKINATAQEFNLPEVFSIGFLAIGYFVLFFLYRLPDPYWMVSIFTFLFLAPANQVALAINKNINAVDVRAERLSGWNWVVVLFGGLLVAFTIVGTIVFAFFPELLTHLANII